MFDTYYTVRWNDEGEPEMLSGRRNGKNYVRLSDGSNVTRNHCGLSPLAAIEGEIMHIAATQAREHEPLRSKRPWKIARMIQKLCQLAKQIRQNDSAKLLGGRHGSTTD